MHVGMKHAWLGQACADQCMQTRQLQKYNHIGLTLDWQASQLENQARKFLLINYSMLTVALIHVFKQPTILKYECLFHHVNKLS